MASETFTLDAPGLAKLAAQLALLLRQDAELRAQQANNAPQASAFDQPSGGVTGATEYNITEAQAASKNFYQLVITFDATSGSGRYRIDGASPTPAGAGVGIPSGGVVLTITGANNIRNFKMVAETGQTLKFARYLFT